MASTKTVAHHTLRLRSSLNGAGSSLARSPRDPSRCHLIGSAAQPAAGRSKRSPTPAAVVLIQRLLSLDDPQRRLWFWYDYVYAGCLGWGDDLYRDRINWIKDAGVVDQALHAWDVHLDAVVAAG
jgi:hypothetical protein